MNRNGPCNPERKLPELPYYVLLYFPGLFIQGIFYILPLDRLHGYQVPVGIRYCYAVIRIKRFHTANLTIVEPPFGIVTDEHDLRALFQDKHLVSRIAVFRKVPFNFSGKRDCLAGQCIELAAVDIVRLPIMGHQTNRL